MPFEGSTMHGGVSLTTVKGIASCFREVRVVLGYLREFHLRLMLDYVKDLVNQELQGVKAEESSVFAVARGVSSLGVGARCPLARFLELSV